jgi:hypothetical protein
MRSKYAQARTKRPLFTTIAALVAGALLALGIVGAGTAVARSMSPNTPDTEIPLIDFHGSAFSRGKIYHAGGCDNIPYTARLYSASGIILDEKSGTINSVCGDVGGVNSNNVQCAGINVKSFLYINDGGTGKSSTSTTTPC